MRLAGIEMKTIITERAGHIRDYLLHSYLDDTEVKFINILNNYQMDNLFVINNFNYFNIYRQ